VFFTTGMTFLPIVKRYALYLPTRALRGAG